MHTPTASIRRTYGTGFGHTNSSLSPPADILVYGICGKAVWRTLSNLHLAHPHYAFPERFPIVTTWFILPCSPPKAVACVITSASYRRRDSPLPNFWQMVNLPFAFCSLMSGSVRDICILLYAITRCVLDQYHPSIRSTFAASHELGKPHRSRKLELRSPPLQSHSRCPSHFESNQFLNPT